MNPELSIIITTYKNLPITAHCLESVISSCAQIPDFEIIISDSESTTKKTELLKNIQKKYPDKITQIIENKNNIGYPKAINAGIEQSTGRYLLIMNADTIVLHEAIPKLLKFLKNNPDIGILAPQLLNPDRSIMASCYKFYRWYTIILRRTFLGKLPWAKKHLAEHLMLDWDHQSTRDVDWIQGSVMMLSRENFQKIGTIDTNIFLYFEDVDWCKRSWEKGLRVTYYPEAQIIHYHERESAKKEGMLSVFTNTMTRTHIKSALYYIKKHWRNNPFPKTYKELLPHS